MDRSYKAKMLVLVYETCRSGPLLASFRQQPYSFCGYENFIYKDRMYKGFDHEGQAYILLSEPLGKETA